MRALKMMNANASPLRLTAALLLAGIASGCSSDVTRFDGLFSSKTDNLTTNSVPHKVNAVNGKLPTPGQDVASVNATDADVTGDQALNQPYPNQDVSYDPISTSTIETRTTVQRTELKTPGVKVQQNVAINQPFPAKVKVDADPIKTGTVKSVWKIADSSPRILIKSGDTLSGISARYKVPQSEILKANKLASGADLKYGKSIIIPVSVKSSKSVPAELAVNTKKIPVPAKAKDQDKAILPNTASRDKQTGDKLAAKNSESDGTGYVVAQGDSLNKIAKQHKVSVDAIKAANGMTTASLRIGQKIVIPVPGADPVKTASIPAGSKVKEVSDAKPKTYTPPVADRSVEEVQKTADNGEDAPDETGIGKFRWPVRGAVIAGYGQNVEGVRNPGIDISVPEGTPIKAAENGVVIYSGAGLKDLGNTVLIRHDNGTVTVYGNASALKVKRGDKVTRGEVIADSGMTGGAKRPKVHFEVRQNAAAVNPMTFLQ
ncbi:LysM peptidoglycan-binding domain-containing M23 family metallopeptidase [Rhizobium sp. TH2]|uniref:LysM peptidoglycan-binding domain-containing M23 family metallopeptidase n=1 Tax=Rhizobium sp. TH2 TaxID=2775403 RepID=UPI002156FA87|nr:LysM peptidoglycan-binding domain-containing M23 family metallopeptidase [Rhizobium sp. TH2]UVC10854.1 LysM peptidoglycan-binding domain-containing M23 family metallopeptidase [Rhizobium sp. TH2]